VRTIEAVRRFPTKLLGFLNSLIASCSAGDARLLASGAARAAAASRDRGPAPDPEIVSQSGRRLTAIKGLPKGLRVVPI